jgi:hypothetical protein
MSAEYYLALASLMGAGRDNSKQYANTKGFYKGRIPNEDQRRRLYMGAHLDSAALRLCTIEEILYRYDVATDGYDSAKVYFKECPKEKTRRRSLHKKLSIWLHIMLRHQVAHDEDNIPNQGTPRQRKMAKQRRKDRRKVLGSAKIKTVLTTLKHIASKIRSKVRRRKLGSAIPKSD